MDCIDKSHTIPESILREFHHLRSDSAKLNSYIANLEKRITQWCESISNMEISNTTNVINFGIKIIDTELRECCAARDQILSQLNCIEHKINCEIMREVHLMCA